MQFTVAQLKQYLAFAKHKLSEAIYDDQKRFYLKAIAKTEADIQALENNKPKLKQIKG